LNGLSERVYPSGQAAPRRGCYLRLTYRASGTGVGGIWERGEESCAVITTKANDLVRPINDRMPVIIAAEDYDRWLDSDFHDTQQLQCMQPFPPGEMILTPEENRARSGQRPEGQQP
jgi:putative SOS response-associated peptidase YedK